MIPEVAEVVAAAKAYAHSGQDVGGRGRLLAAVDALEIRESRAAGGPTYEEEDREWGEVVVGDEILSVKTNRWYEVTRTVTDGTGKVKVNIKGAPQPIVRKITDPVKVKRGVLGDAADLFTILWSADTGSARTVATQGVEPLPAEVTSDEEDTDG
jgi:hypothetical protein